MFPSPPGTFYFLIIGHMMDDYESYVSVPSGDFLFSNTQKQLKEMVAKFPSPPGTFYFLIWL